MTPFAILLVLAAILILGERPSALAMAGGAVIVASIFFLTGGEKLLRPDQSHRPQAIGCGLMSGVFIAAYTL